ncbi:MAG: L-threonylcarbamoyladenylate synthase [Clostridiales bacterium]
MDTKWIKTNEITPKEYKAAIAYGAELLNNGEIVAFPTETVYGLGGNAFNSEAASKIYAAKGRPADNPLIVHISYIDMLEEVVSDIPSVCRRLAFEFWPGPLTMILPKSDKVPKSTTGGLDTVAVRMPSHGVALDLIDAAGIPIAAPSANLSGKPSPTRGSHVYHDMIGRIPLILDSGAVDIGLESTIIDLTLPEPVILRPGKLTFADLKPFVPRLKENRYTTISNLEQPKAPGMKYKHYAPDANVFLIPSEDKGVEFIKTRDIKGKSAVIVSENRWEDIKNYINPNLKIILGPTGDFEALAHNLFHALRQCDVEKIEEVYIEEFPEDGLGEALMNRIKKAVVK